MRTKTTLELNEDDLRKLKALLASIPYDATQKLPADIRKFHQELYDELKDV